MSAFSAAPKYNFEIKYNNNNNKTTLVVKAFLIGLGKCGNGSNKTYTQWLRQSYVWGFAPLLMA